MGNHHWTPEAIEEMDLRHFLLALDQTDRYNRAVAAAMGGADG